MAAESVLVIPLAVLTTAISLSTASILFRMWTEKTTAAMNVATKMRAVTPATKYDDLLSSRSRTW
jgi:hypothetical protein